MNLLYPQGKAPIPVNNETCDHLKNTKIPNISLPTQNGNLLNLNRSDTFRLVIYFYPMTGHPNKSLPHNWNSITGARGCTSQTCSFRDNYDELVSLNALPIGITTQSIDDIKEMTTRLQIPYDVLSDQNLILVKIMNLPTFSIKKNLYIKRLTLIVEKTYIKKVFYPVLSPNKHIKDVLNYLKRQQT